MALESIALEARQLAAVHPDASARLLRQVEFLRAAIACAEVDE